MDEIDRASKEIDFQTKLALLNMKRETLQNKGECYNCGEQITQKFCDSDCRDDYEARQRMRR